MFPEDGGTGNKNNRGMGGGAGLVKAVIPNKTSREQDSTALAVYSQFGIIDTFFDRHLICGIY